MGKYDKDRFQKELAVRYCLARRAIPFLEVVVRNASDLSDHVEVLTDIDVLGVEASGDGGLRRTIFDCKTSTRMSSINRAFWACGVTRYTGCDEAFVILKGKTVQNHRISSLRIGVDLHDENSFIDLGKTFDVSFPSEGYYQSSIDQWNAVYDCYNKAPWTERLFDLCRNLTPLSKAPWSIFRRIVGEIRAMRGYFDPSKDCHKAIFLDVLASCFVLWAEIGRDVRRLFDPAMSKEDFEKVFRYYIWGGKESYIIRQHLRERVSGNGAHVQSIELPAWGALIDFAGLIVNSPQSLIECAHACRELSIKTVCGARPELDANLTAVFARNTRIRQFASALNDYLVAAGSLPRDMAKEVQAVIFAA